jgi:hypothetical protein
MMEKEQECFAIAFFIGVRAGLGPGTSDGGYVIRQSVASFWLLQVEVKIAGKTTR